MTPYERERPLSEADRIVSAYIVRRGWSAEMETLGDALVTSKCTLRDADGRVVSDGFGKGEASASEVGAKYEAVEHYFSRTSASTGDVGLIRSESISRDPRFSSLPFLAAFESNVGRMLACKTYRSFSDGTSIDIPCFMTCADAVGQRPPGDDFDYSSANRYSSNNGTAIGASFEEAAVHAIGELVERDAWSHFLIAHFLGDPAGFGTAVDPASLPDEVARIHREAERQLEREVLLIDATTDLDVPVFIATTGRCVEGEVIRPHGCGASLYPAYAGIRALTELVQYVDVKRLTSKMAALDVLALRMLDGYPKLRDCARFEVDGQRLRHGSWRHRPSPAGDLATLLAGLVERLTANGIGLYFSMVHDQSKEFCVVSCVSMELERFFLVTAGLVLAPGRRGMRLLEQAPAYSRSAVAG